MKDLAVAEAHQHKKRRDWGLDNIVGMQAKPIRDLEKTIKRALAQRKVRAKIANFQKQAIYPQQLTVPRQYATTREGVFLYKILKGRQIGDIQEDGVRVIVQENAQMARFIISPLFISEYDALQWAKSHTGVDL